MDALGRSRKQKTPRHLTETRSIFLHPVGTIFLHPHYDKTRDPTDPQLSPCKHIFALCPDVPDFLALCSRATTNPPKCAIGLCFIEAFRESIKPVDSRCARSRHPRKKRKSCYGARASIRWRRMRVQRCPTDRDRRPHRDDQPGADHEIHSYLRRLRNGLHCPAAHPKPTLLLSRGMPARPATRLAARATAHRL